MATNWQLWVYRGGVWGIIGFYDSLAEAMENKENFPDLYGEQQRCRIVKVDLADDEPPGDLFPYILQTPRFELAWNAWLEMRRAKRFSVKESYIRKQIAFLEGLGEAAAVEALEISTRNEYQGLFAPRGGQASGMFRGPTMFASDP